MKKDTTALKVFQSIINQAKANLEELCNFWNIYEKQLFFVSAIAIYDRYFIEQLPQKDKRSFNDRITEYSYPVFIRQFYDVDFCKLSGIVHKPLNREQLELYAKLIYSCGIIGWMQSLIENSTAGFYTCRAFWNYIRVSFSEKFHWNELIESEYCNWYSTMVAQFQEEEYQRLDEQLPEILKKLKTGIFVWDKHFLGYSNDLETEQFFNRHALLDAQQSVAWDKNVNQREAVFRTQLYTVFDDPRFSCVQHPVIIKEKNKTLTDIDAVVIDKKTGEIALFQLKWQDPADYSPFTLKSKRSNYYSAAEKWLEIIEKWLSNSADEDIASKLGVKGKYFDKKKISIFVLGRRRGNYSGNGPYPYECAWSQWYQIMYAASYLRQENEFTISNLYKLIVSTSPFNIKISEKPVTFCYGKYRIKFGGKTFCGKDTR